MSFCTKTQHTKPPGKYQLCSTDGTTIVSLFLCRIFSSFLNSKLCHLLRQLLETPQLPGQLGKRCPLLLEVLDLSRRGAEIDLAGTNPLAARDAGLRRDGHAVFEDSVIGDTDLAGKDAEITNLYTAGDADLRNNDAVLADFSVVPDLHLVIDFCATPDDC